MAYATSLVGHVRLSIKDWFLKSYEFSDVHSCSRNWRARTVGIFFYCSHGMAVHVFVRSRAGPGVCNLVFDATSSALWRHAQSAWLIASPGVCEPDLTISFRIGGKQSDQWSWSRELVTAETLYACVACWFGDVLNSSPAAHSKRPCSLANIQAGLCLSCILVPTASAHLL